MLVSRRLLAELSELDDVQETIEISDRLSAGFELKDRGRRKNLFLRHLAAIERLREIARDWNSSKLNRVQRAHAGFRLEHNTGAVCVQLQPQPPVLAQQPKKTLIRMHEL